MSVAPESPSLIARPTMPSTDADQVHQLLDVGSKVLDQALDLLNNSLSSDDQLSISSKFLPGSTIGKHLRHARDHFELLLDCIAAPPPYVLSYDVRVRNTPVETSLKAAREAIAETKKRLALAVPRVELGAPLTLNAVTPYEQVFASSVGREVWPCPLSMPLKQPEFMDRYGSPVCTLCTTGQW
jgi:hypothetical protein